MKFLTLLIFILVSQGLSGQGITKTGSGLFEYKYGDLYYSYQELREILQTDNEALRMHKKAIRARKTSRILYRSAIATGIASFIYISTDSNCVDLCGFVVITSALVITVPMILGAIGTNISYHKRKPKSVQLFNDGLRDGMKNIGALDQLESNEWSMHFGQTPNGIGFVVQF